MYMHVSQQCMYPSYYLAQPTESDLGWVYKNRILKGWTARFLLIHSRGKVVHNFVWKKNILG